MQDAALDKAIQSASEYTSEQLRQYDALEGAMKDSTDFALLWHALEEYRLASLLLESLQPIEEHGVMHHLAAKIEHNAKFCIEAAVDLHASLVASAVQKVILDLVREEA
jgi:hypothetical protein